ncbi:MAG: pyridoxamine 5'-phosphate oxidase family protein [Candidatus Yanofskybacteria bacterium]|nr:pyridoxamine 5'-phosphate oxidase family protein [Candidatus Yanofskybacteria bacterium]
MVVASACAISNGMDKQKLTKFSLDFLRKQKIAFVSTVSAQGDPQVAMIYCAVDDDFTFNFITTSGSRKFQNIKNNPHVAIAVGSPEDLITIQCGGHAVLVDYGNTDVRRGGEIIHKVMSQAGLTNSPEWPVLLSFPKTELGLFTVKPDWMVLLDLNYKKDPDNYAHEYQVVLP